jgi:formamidopyrimidine-DNA glycosylase
VPELPEVETMRRGVLEIVGSRIAGALRPRCRLRPISFDPPWRELRRRALGNCIVAVERAGKRLALVLESGEHLAFEPRMTGLVLLGSPPDRQHVRLQLELNGGRAERLTFWDRRGLGRVRLLSRDELFRGLGPDALTVTAAWLASGLGGSRRAIKPALLDQSVVAGIGNLYAAEILYCARIDPRLPCRDLSPAQWRALSRAARSVLASAVRHEGSTLSDGTYRNALNEAGRYQNRHRVYDREGRACRRCGAPIERIVQAQRSTYYCRGCQAE